jgi:group I intron endonuclease
MKNSISGIYQIRNIINGKCYIGSSINIQERWGAHKRTLRKNQHYNKYLQRAWNKHGEGCFEFTVLETCFYFALIFREQYYINILKPEYNNSPTAGSPLGTIQSIESRQKRSKALKGRVFTPEQRKEIYASRTGRKHTEEVCAKISKSNTGKIRSLETCAKLSIAHKGQKPSPETLLKISTALTGHVVSLETRAKLSKASIGNKRNVGKKHTTERKMKLSSAIKEWWKKRKAGRH